METNEKITAGIIAVFIMLAGVGGTIYLTDDQFADAYICPLNENVGIFHRLSESGKTGYFNDDGGTEQRKACRSGNTYAPYIKLTTYALERSIDPMSFILRHDFTAIPSSEPSPGAKVWECPTNGPCQRIET